jgi:UDPglucose 6-dehydrogenase
MIDDHPHPALGPAAGTVPVSAAHRRASASDRRPRVSVVGLGYVGLTLAALLAETCVVVAVDIDQERVRLVNARLSPIADPELQGRLASSSLQLTATTDLDEALTDADFVVVATPTNYDPVTNYFDTSTVEDVIARASSVSSQASIIIKSTVPVGFTSSVRATHPDLCVAFSPEFLREGRALYDNLHPSRIVVGGTCECAHRFAALLLDAALDDDVPVRLTGSEEAEAIKLFANTYLAMRVAFFNELDTYAATHLLRAKDIIEGIGLDPRIGSGYNNPSFGYGGYCLPKDTKQLLANYQSVPQDLIRAVVDANVTRIDFIVSDILAKSPRVVGLYRLVMKSGSDNIRSSSMVEVLTRLVEEGAQVVVHEPTLPDGEFLGCRVIGSVDEFFAASDVVVANRFVAELAPVADKVYTRDVFGRD